MPRRLNPDVVMSETVADGQVQDANGNADVISEAAPSFDLLRERGREYLDLNQQIKDLGAQTAVLRKSLKNIEKALFNGMLLSGLEELEIEGVKISRIRKLQTKEE